MTPETTGVLNLEAGECFTDPEYSPAAGEEVVLYTTCDQHADNQSYGFVHADDGPYDRAALAAFGWSSCERGFAHYWPGEAAGRAGLLPDPADRRDLGGRRPRHHVRGLRPPRRAARLEAAPGVTAPFAAFDRRINSSCVRFRLTSIHRRMPISTLRPMCGTRTTAGTTPAGGRCWYRVSPRARSRAPSAAPPSPTCTSRCAWRGNADVRLYAGGSPWTGGGCRVTWSSWSPGGPPPSPIRATSRPRTVQVHIPSAAVGAAAGALGGREPDFEGLAAAPRGGSGRRAASPRAACSGAAGDPVRGVGGGLPLDARADPRQERAPARSRARRRPRGRRHHARLASPTR